MGVKTKLTKIQMFVSWQKKSLTISCLLEFLNRGLHKVNIPKPLSNGAEKKHNKFLVPWNAVPQYLDHLPDRKWRSLSWSLTPSCVKICTFSSQWSWGPENKTATNHRPTFWITIGPLSRSQSSCNVKSWWILCDGAGKLVRFDVLPSGFTPFKL